MPGFFISSEPVSLQLNNYASERCLQQSLQVPGITAKRNTLDRFLQDKAFAASEKAVIISDGFVLNKAELFAEFNASAMDELLWKMYTKLGECFPNRLRGCFSGALWDREKDLWLIFTNHIGDGSIFYAVENGHFYAGSQVNYVLDACRTQKLALHFNEQAAYEMLTFGYMESDATYAREIQRLRGGTCLRVERGRAEIITYHTFGKHPERFAGRSEEEILDALDAAFRHAVEMEYAKDEEYGFHHLTDISGGLDSRMNVFVAHSLAPRHLQLITYGKADGPDEEIAKKISAFWKDELLIKTLDDNTFLYDVEEIVFLLGGCTAYCGITGGKRMLESLNMELFGLEHTGQVGDAIVGSFYKTPSDIVNNLPTKKNSERLVHRLEKKTPAYHDTFEDHEIYLLYTRGFQSACNSHQIRKNFTEVVSPFLDVELLQLCLDIPAEKRMQHALYKKWIISKYPDAARFPWEAIGAKITDPPITLFCKKALYKGPGKLRRMLGRDQNDSYGMNPLDYWIHHNEAIRQFMDQYEEAGYVWLPADASAQLREDMQELYRTGNAVEKCMVMTVLASAKLYFAG